MHFVWIGITHAISNFLSLSLYRTHILYIYCRYTWRPTLAAAARYFVRLFIFTFQWASQTNVWHAFTKFLFFCCYFIYGSFFSHALMLFSHWMHFNVRHSIFELLWTNNSDAHMFWRPFFPLRMCISSKNCFPTDSILKFYCVARSNEV